jgi:hypothetical protein
VNRRRPTAKQRVVAELRTRGPRGLTTAEISHPSIGGIRASGRVHELREDGYVIHVSRVRDGCYRYVLIAEPDGTLVDPAPPGDAPAALFQSSPPPSADAIAGLEP